MRSRRIIRWPVNDHRGAWWLVEYTEGRGYFPLREISKTRPEAAQRAPDGYDPDPWWDAKGVADAAP